MFTGQNYDGSFFVMLFVLNSITKNIIDSAIHLQTKSCS